MNNLMTALLSYTFAAMAGICFVSGVSLLSGRGEKWQ